MQGLGKSEPRETVKLRQALSALFFLALAVLFSGSVAADAPTLLDRYLKKVPVAEVATDADAYGAPRADIPVAPLLRAGEIVGYAFITSDFVGTTGYSGKPIHVMVGVGLDGKVLGAALADHSEPIVLIGIPDSKIKALTARYAGLDLLHEAETGGSGHELEIISGATVTIMVIDDSIVRAGLKVARALGLGGLEPLAAPSGPRFEIDPEHMETQDWITLEGNGSVRRLALDIGQINAAFEAGGDQRAIKRPEPGAPEETFIDMRMALVSVPSIGRSLLGEAEYANLQKWLKPDEHAILVAGRGRYSFKGSGYVRGGIFDRIQLISGDISVRFRDKMHRRLGAIAAPGAPKFSELDLFKIPADSGFDPTTPFRLQLLAQRAVGPVEKTFLTFDLGYRLPEAYLRRIEITPAMDIAAEPTEAEAKQALWKRVWQDKSVEIGLLLGMLAILTGAFFFQHFVTRNERLTFWFRIGFLTATLFFVGWYANAQLSVVNLLALANALTTGFSWDAFLLDPMLFILWFAVAAALLFWGRGAYCGWLCPFGALQELTNRLAKLCRVPQIEMPWGLHERLWPLKYMIFLALLGLSFVSLPLAEHYSEVEPFKTAIVLKFQRGWPYVAFAIALLAAGLFIERFYCRYLCPLGAALAIPGRLRMFDWLDRYHACGNPCHVCKNECMVQAIDVRGRINPNECLYCLHCQVRYQDDYVCPVRVKKRKRRESNARQSAPVLPKVAAE